MSYGRNFEFRVAPQGGQRAGRFHVPATGSPIPIGAPVAATGAAEDDRGLAPVALATGAQNPKPGTCGIALFEYKGDDGWSGHDPYLTVFADLDTVPLNGAVQVVSGDSVKVCFTNTTAVTFLNSRAYPGRVMVAGLGATPTVAVGDYLTPGTGNDTSGYWAETGTASQAWLVVTRVDNTRGEVEARMVF